MTKHNIAATTIASVLLLPFSAQSADSDVRRLAGALFINMAVSHYCRFVDGEEDYQAARSLTRELLAPLMGAEEAERHIDGVDTSLKGDPSSKAKHATAEMCKREKADAAIRIEQRLSEMPKRPD